MLNDLIDLNSSDPGVVLQAVTQFRRLLSVEHDPPIQSLLFIIQIYIFSILYLHFM